MRLLHPPKPQTTKRMPGATCAEIVLSCICFRGMQVMGISGKIRSCLSLGGSLSGLSCPPRFSAALFHPLS